LEDGVGSRGLRVGLSGRLGAARVALLEEVEHLAASAKIDKTKKDRQIETTLTIKSKQNYYNLFKKAQFQDTSSDECGIYSVSPETTTCLPSLSRKASGGESKRQK
jgi:hypothetical protein